MLRSVLAAGVFSVMAAQAGSLLIVDADSGGVASVVTAMQATGQFSSVTELSAQSTTPTLAQLSGYSAILAYTDNAPANGTALGNVLDQYYALGGKALTIGTYAFSPSWQISGAVMSGNDAALTNLGTDGAVSGRLVATVPGDPIFNGINLSNAVFFNNSNFAHPGLAAGATLLATDGAGIDMIARSANGIIDVNLFPGNSSSNNAVFYSLLANTLTQTTSQSPVPEPASILMLGTIVSVLALALKRGIAG